MMNIQQELDKSKNYTLTRVFTFDKKTDRRNNVGDKFFAYISSKALNSPKDTECEKGRLIYLAHHQTRQLQVKNKKFTTFLEF